MLVFPVDNVDVPTVCGLTPPLGSREEAEQERRRFEEAERTKRPWVVFESADTTD
jgi:hypothetical protein